ncbi:hypothetical protein KIPB_003902, partial [Kipferlia bialata]
DLGSRNGTFCNDVRLHDCDTRLSDGDLLKFGYDTATYRLEIQKGSVVQRREGREGEGRQLDPSVSPPRPPKPWHKKRQPADRALGGSGVQIYAPTAQGNRQIQTHGEAMQHTQPRDQMEMPSARGGREGVPDASPLGAWEEREREEDRRSAWDDESVDEAREGGRDGEVIEIAVSGLLPRGQFSEPEPADRDEGEDEGESVREPPSLKPQLSAYKSPPPLVTMDSSFRAAVNAPSFTKTMDIGCQTTPNLLVTANPTVTSWIRDLEALHKAVQGQGIKVDRAGCELGRVARQLVSQSDTGRDDKIGMRPSVSVIGAPTDREIQPVPPVSEGDILSGFSGSELTAQSREKYISAVIARVQREVEGVTRRTEALEPAVREVISGCNRRTDADYKRIRQALADKRVNILDHLDVRADSDARQAMTRRVIESEELVSLMSGNMPGVKVIIDDSSLNRGVTEGDHSEASSLNGVVIGPQTLRQLVGEVATLRQRNAELTSLVQNQSVSRASTASGPTAPHGKEDVAVGTLFKALKTLEKEFVTMIGTDEAKTQQSGVGLPLSDRERQNVAPVLAARLTSLEIDCAAYRDALVSALAEINRLRSTVTDQQDQVAHSHSQLMAAHEAYSSEISRVRDFQRTGGQGQTQYMSQGPSALDPYADPRQSMALSQMGQGRHREREVVDAPQAVPYIGDIVRELCSAVEMVQSLQERATIAEEAAVKARQEVGWINGSTEAVQILSSLLELTEAERDRAVIQVVLAKREREREEAERSQEFGSLHTLGQQDMESDAPPSASVSTRIRTSPVEDVDRGRGEGESEPVLRYDWLSQGRRR